MKQIIFVTTNEGKLQSAREYIKDTEVISYKFELDEPRSDDVKYIAKKKVEQAYNILKKPCIALDAGFFIDELNGFPRAYVNPTLETIGIKGLIKLMEGVDNRDCHFKECLAYYDGIEFKTFESIHKCTMSGVIEDIEHERQWSELWKIVIPEGFSEVISLLSDEDFEKFRINSDKNSCMGDFGEWYTSIDELTI